MLILLREEHPAKAEEPNRWSPSGKTTFLRQVSPENALDPISDIEEGIATDTSFLRFLRAFSLMDLTLNCLLLYSTDDGIFNSDIVSDVTPSTLTVKSTVEVMV